MAKIIYSKNLNELILSGGRKISIFNTIEQKPNYEIYLPEGLEKLIPTQLPSVGTDDDQDDNDETKPKSDENCKIKANIQHIELSPNNNFLAVTTSGHKCFLLYERNKNGTFDLVSIRHIPRVSSTLTFTNNSNNVIICDKTGDCYLFDCKDNPKLPGKWILGHLSIVYDIKLSHCNNYLATSDRDEKIRITNYPNCHEIESYCLGHKEYISSINFLQNHSNYLLSLSGDKTMILWDWKIGKKIKVFQIKNSGIKFSMRSPDSNTYEIAVLLFEPNYSISVYKLEIPESDEKINLDLVSENNLDNLNITNLCYLESSILATISNKNSMKIETFNISKNDKIEYKQLKSSIEVSFQNEDFIRLEDVSDWFKKKFDNVTDYLERKKRRIETKEKKVEHVIVKEKTLNSNSFSRKKNQTQEVQS